jgi:hypothetical protein
MERENGFYWVKFMDKWTICEWLNQQKHGGGEFRYKGKAIFEYQMEEIQEEKLKPKS